MRAADLDTADATEMTDGAVKKTTIAELDAEAKLKVDDAKLEQYHSGMAVDTGGFEDTAAGTDTTNIAHVIAVVNWMDEMRNMVNAARCDLLVRPMQHAITEVKLMVDGMRRQQYRSGMSVYTGGSEGIWTRGRNGVVKFGPLA